MRFFTALTACALVMSACSQGVVVEPASDNSGGSGSPDATRGGKGSMIGFSKVVQTGENEFRPATKGEFSFEMYAQKQNGKGGSTLVETYSTDANGEVWIDFTSLKGNSRLLTFREVFASEEDAAKWEPLADFVCDVVPSSGAIWDGVPFEFNNGPVIVNVPVPEAQEPELGPTVDDSITLTNDHTAPLTIAKSNGKGDHHFCYAVLNVADLAEGVVLDMVVGANFKKVGEVLVKLVEGEITITVIDGVGGESFSGKTGTGKPVFVNNGNDLSYPIVCPAEGVFTLYAHSDGKDVRFYI